MASHVIQTASARPLAERWSELKHRFQDWRAARRRREQIWRELHSYTDRELFDLGITRADIPAIVAGTYSRY
jgi:uncharacterized protein YjiS (DUF1127 family)